MTHKQETSENMPVTLRTLLFILFFSLMAGCATVQTGGGGSYGGFTETGKASYYANKLQNRKTANGEHYRHELYTAAHKTLPFGSKVRVTNIKNHKSVVVRINDRGPFIKGRIIDLSKSAFSRIATLSSGLIRVKIEVLNEPAQKHPSYSHRLIE